MLSISFHLNTGMYLLDTDAGHRTIVGDNEIDNMNDLWAATGTNAQGKKVLSPQIEAYAQTSTSGPVHVCFELAKTYSALQFARLIVHEASHTFRGTSDVRYAHAGDYYNLSSG